MNSVCIEYKVQVPEITTFTPSFEIDYRWSGGRLTQLERRRSGGRRQSGGRQTWFEEKAVWGATDAA